MAKTLLTYIDIIQMFKLILFLLMYLVTTAFDLFSWKSNLDIILLEVHLPFIFENEKERKKIFDLCRLQICIRWLIHVQILMSNDY